MSDTEKRDRSLMTRLAQLKAAAEREFGSGTVGQDASDRLLTLIDDFETLTTELRAVRDDIGGQLRGSVAGRRADAAYRASAGLGRKPQ